MATRRKSQRRWEVAAVAERSARGQLPAIGLEAEFATVVDGEAMAPEDVFGSPRRFVRGPLLHRAGRSYHLPTGGALYFDTGVMEVATPMIEIARGCGAQGTRALWESIAFLRGELDAWEAGTGRSIRLVGFSTHYNVSFDLPHEEQTAGRTVNDLAYLLTYILAAPVMLLAANKRSTGIGVRPRGNRIEITADFTPDALLMAATATLIVGIVRAVMTWPSYGLEQMAQHGMASLARFIPRPHSSRKGWVAKDTSFTANPFAADVDAPTWQLTSGRYVSMRDLAGRTVRTFWPSITALGDPLSLQLIAAIMRGRADSLLDLDDRPAAYDDVGRLCTWKDLFPVLSRSRYERVIGHAVAGRRVKIGGAWHKPVGVRGWTHVVMRREKDGSRSVRSLDDLLRHLDAWDRTANRRGRERRALPEMSIVAERRQLERRVPLVESEERRRKSDVALVDEQLETKSASAKRAAKEPPLVIVSRI